MELNDKVAIVTGGASGIGKEMVIALLDNDIQNIAILDINEENGQKFHDELSEKYGNDRTIFIKTDVSKKQDIEAAFDKTFKTFNKIDIVINNAGVGEKDGNYSSVIDINLSGVLHGVYEGLKYMSKEHGGQGGVIVNNSSIVALMNSPINPAYVATKHGIIGATRCLNNPLTYERTGVRVIAICPGATETPLLENLEKREMWNVIKQKLNIRSQKPDSVGRATVHLIKNHKKEYKSVWMIQNGNLYKINFPKLEQLAELAKENV